MAKTITDERIKLTIEINGSAAQKEILDLEKSTIKLKNKVSDLNFERKLVEKQLGKESAEYKRLTREININSIEIDKNEAKIKELVSALKISDMTISQLQTKAKLLSTTLRHLAPNTADYKKYTSELDEVNARLSELRGKAQTARFSLGSLADGFNRYQALAFSFVAALTGVVLSVQKILDINGKLSDSQSDVMKTTGMTKQEVDELTKSFGLLKTRTARTELLGLATEAGRLGITGTENVRAFVEQANKLKVALGDDLSDEAIREVGKMVNVYKVGEATGKDFAGSMDALGSSINEVAASGANQAGFLVDYLKRQAGIAAQTKLSAADNIGYAATFDEIGQSVEVSATAMNKVWMDMFENPTEYAKIAKMSVADFNKLLTTDSNAAMIKFLEGLRGNNGGLAVMLDKLKDLDVGGTRGVQALAALANNTEILKQRQLTSNEALIEANSLTDEYTLKNENLAAIIQKMQKWFMGLFSSEAFINGITNAFSWFGKLIGATEDLSGEVEGFRNRLILFLKVLTVIIASYLSYNVAIRLTTGLTRSITVAQTLYNAVQARGAIIANVLRGAQLLLSAAFNFMIGNLAGATAAMKLFNLTVKASPLGILITILATVATALIVFKKKTEDVGTTLKALNSETELAIEINKEFEKQFASSSQELKAKIEPLISILKDQNLSLHTRKKAYEELIKIAPEFTSTVDKEYKATAKLDEVYRNLLNSMAEKMRFQAMQKIMQKNYDEEAKALAKIIELETKKKELDKAQKDFQKSRRDNRLNLDIMWEQKEVNEKLKVAYEEQNIAQKNQAQILNYRKKQIEALELEQKKYVESSKEWLEIQSKINSLLNIGSSPKVTINSEDPVIPFTPEVKDKTPKKYDDSYLKDEEKFANELLKLQRDNEEARINMLKSSYAREYLMEVEKHDQKLYDNQLANEEILKNELKVQKDLEEATKASDTKKVISAKKQLEYLAKTKTELAEQIEHDEYMHLLRLGTIQEKAGQEEIENIAKDYERQKMLRETAFNEELAQLNLSEEEKAKRKEQFQKNELEKEEAFLNEQLSKYEDILSGKNIDDIQFTLLSEEGKEKFKEEYELIKNALSILKEKLSGINETTNLGIGGTVDILGYTVQEWYDAFSNLDNLENKIKASQMAISGLQNLWSQFNNYQSAAENAQVRNSENTANRRKNTLKRQLDSGIISQDQYAKQVEFIDKDLDKKKAEIEYKQAKRQKAMTIANIIQNTALSIVKLWASPGFPLAVPLTAMVAGIGALQLATAAKTPLPARGYEDGFYPVKREQDGKMYNAKMGGKSRSGIVRKPTIFLAGENGENFPEMIIDGRSYARFSPELKQAMDRELKGIKGFENGFYNQANQRYEIPRENGSPSNNNDLELIKAMYAMLAENTAVMKDLRDSGIIAYFSRDMRDTKKLKEELDKYQSIKDNAKQ